MSSPPRERYTSAGDGAAKRDPARVRPGPHLYLSQLLDENKSFTATIGYLEERLLDAARSLNDAAARASAVLRDPARTDTQVLSSSSSALRWSSESHSDMRASSNTVQSDTLRQPDPQDRSEGRFGLTHSSRVSSPIDSDVVAAILDSSFGEHFEWAELVNTDPGPLGDEDLVNHVRQSDTISPTHGAPPQDLKANAPLSLPRPPPGMLPNPQPMRLSLMPSRAPAESRSPPYPGRPSVFCRDILELEAMVRKVRIKQYQGSPSKRQSVERLVVKMIKILLVQKWPSMKILYEETRLYDSVVPITCWRIDPSPENYYHVPHQYRPTEAQLLNLHWPIVDWFLHASLRDKLILNADQYDLDEVCELIMENFCFQLDQSPDRPPAGSEMELDRDLEDAGAKEGESVTAGTASTSKVYYRLQEFVQYRQLVSGSRLTAKSPAFVGRLSTGFIVTLQGTPEETFKVDSPFFERFPGLHHPDIAVSGVLKSIFCQ